MFTISILNYENGNDPTNYTESVIQTIPSSGEGALKLISPVVKNEMGNAETFDFSIEGGTKFYDAFKQMKTYVTVKYDNDYIFSGRVLTVDTSFYGTRRIRCEGALAFLGDTPVEGVEESKRKKVWTSEYVYNLLADHNYWVGQGPRYMIMSEVPGNYSSLTSKNQQIKAEQRKYGSDSNSDTKSTLEDLRSYYGGYFRTRVAPGGIQNGHYLDWMDHYFNPEDPSTATIELGKNIIDFSSVTEVDNIFTIIIPVGKRTVKNSNTTTSKTSSTSQNFYLDDYLLNIRNYEAYDGRDTNRLAKRYISVPTITRGEIYNLASLDFTYDDLNSGYHSVEEYANATTQFGWIYKTVSFDTASTQEELFKQAMKWIKNNYSGAVTKFTIKAIDMHQIGENTRKIMVGDRVKIVYPITDESGKLSKATITLTCLSVSYDLYNPENNSYTFGKPANMLTKTYGLTKTGKSVDKGSNTTKNRDEPTDKEAGVWLQQVKSWLFNHKIHYSGTKPYVSGDSGQSGPYFIEDSYGGYTLQKCVPQHYTPGYGTDSWDLSNTTFFEGYSDITEVEIFDSGVISYVYTEYGVNLQNINGTTMPTEAYSNDGTRFTFKKLAESLIPKYTITGIIPFITSEYKPNTGVLMYRACKTINVAVKEATNAAGPKIVGRSVFDEAGNFIVSKAKSDASFTNEAFSDAVKIIGATGDVRYLSKAGDEKSIQDLEDTVNNRTDGLVQRLSDAGITIGYMKNALNILGAEEIDANMESMIEELEMNGITVNALTNKVNVIGATVGDETSGLVKRLYDDENQFGGDITLLTQAINIIGGSDLTSETAATIENLARKGISVTALTAAVNIIGTSTYTAEVGQKIEALSAQGLTVTALTSDVVVCEGRLDAHDAKFATINADWIRSTIANTQYLSVQSITGTGSITGKNLYSQNGDIIFRTMGSDGVPSDTSLKNALFDINVSKSGDVYTIQKRDYNNKVDNKWVNITQKIDTGNVTTLSAGNVYATGNVYVRRQNASGVVTKEVNLSTAVKNAHITLSGNTYTLHLYNLFDEEIAYADSSHTATFSRATTLSSAWGSGSLFPLTVNASPQGNKYTIGFDTTSDVKLVMDKNGDAELDGTSGKYLKQDVIIQEKTGSTSYVTRYTQKIYGINSTPAYNKGWNNCQASVSLPDTNTSSAIATFKIPNSTVDGSSLERKYQIYTSYQSWDSNAYVYLYDNTNSREVARLSVGDLYTKGTNHGKNLAVIGYDSDSGGNYVYVNFLTSEYPDSYRKSYITLDSGSLDTSTGKRTLKAKLGAAVMDSYVCTDYSSGKIAGRDDVGLAINEYEKKVKVNTSDSSTKEVSITASASISYDGGSHRYTAHATAKAGSHSMGTDSDTGGTEAYEAGKGDGRKDGYEDGWKACIGGGMSYWWYGEETDRNGHVWWDICRPNSDAWIYSWNGWNAYNSAKNSSWTNVGHYWDAACKDLTAWAGSNITAESHSQVAGGAWAFLQGTQADSNGYYTHYLWVSTKSSSLSGLTNGSSYYLYK